MCCHFLLVNVYSYIHNTSLGMRVTINYYSNIIANVVIKNMIIGKLFIK